MHVVFGHVRQLVIHDLRQLIDVDPARCDVGGNKRLQRARFEFSERFGASALALIAVDGHGGNARFFELLSEAISAVLSARKNERLRPFLLTNEMHEKLCFVRFINQHHRLIDDLDRRVAASNLDHLWVVQQAIGKRFNVVGKCSAEEQILPLWRQHCEHLFDVVNEAHVEHAVGLIEHEDFNLREIDRTLAVEIEQSTRRCHHDIDTVTHGLNLWIDAHTTEDAGRGHRQKLAVDTNALFHLRGQLASGREDQCAGKFFAARTVGRWQWRLRGKHQPLQHRQHKARRFSGTGLGTTEQIPAFEHRWDGLLLNRRRRAVTMGKHGADELIA